MSILGVVQEQRVWLKTFHGKVAHLCVIREGESGNLQGMALCKVRVKSGWYSPFGQRRCSRCLRYEK
jgi:hypothetical protein